MDLLLNYIIFLSVNVPPHFACSLSLERKITWSLMMKLTVMTFEFVEESKSVTIQIKGI